MAERSPGGYGPSSSSTGFKHCSARRFGKPSVAGISTEVIWEHSSVGEDEDEIAVSFGLSLTDVRWALSYETARRAA